MTIDKTATKTFPNKLFSFFFLRVGKRSEETKKKHATHKTNQIGINQLIAKKEEGKKI